MAAPLHRNASETVHIGAESAERLIGAAMLGATSPGTVESRVRSIFECARPLYRADVEFQIHLFIRLDRDPAPLLLDRIWYGPVYDRIEPRPMAYFQKNVDENSFALKTRVGRARRAPQRAHTNTMAEMIGEEAARRVRDMILKPAGFADVLLSDWMSSPDRLLTLHTVRKSDQPYTTEDRALNSLLIHAVGSLMDHHARTLQPGKLSRLSHRQLEALRELLRGNAVLEEAVERRLLTFFNAADREALVMQFIDPEALEEIDELIRICTVEEADNH